MLVGLGVILEERVGVTVVEAVRVVVWVAVILDVGVCEGREQDGREQEGREQEGREQEGRETRGTPSRLSLSPGSRKKLLKNAEFKCFRKWITLS